VNMTFIAWTSYHRRSGLLAQHLGATIHHICRGRQGELVLAPLRYLAQARASWRVLRQERPDIVFVQNPPIFSVLVVSLYARRYKARYVIDSHTGTFLSPKWRWSLGLHHLLSHGALTTIVHNKSQEEIVKEWKCRYTVLADPLGDFPKGEPFHFDGQFNVAVVGSSFPDEPTDVMLEAARKLKGVCFYFTGDFGRIDRRLLRKKPENCYFTGYLPDEQYVGLLRGADSVMVLTTRDHTLLCGAFEAVSLGTPLIISDWPILREYFSKGTVYIPNTVEGVCGGVRQAQGEPATLRRDILLLREELQAEWELRFRDLQSSLSEV
jgi:glycosyltransferase involved in cell wall biosynthesis